MEKHLQLIEELFYEGPIVIFRWLPSEDWKVSFVTGNVENLTGYTKEEWLENKIAYKDIVHPEDLPRVQDEVYQNSYQKKLKRWKHEPYRLIKKTGEEIWIQDYTICTYTQDHPEFYIGYILDITNEFLQKKELESQLELYFSFFEKHSAVMLIINPADGKIIRANDSACKFYGYTKEELQKKYIYEINTLSNEEIQLKMKQAKLQKQNYLLFRHKLANNKIKDVEVYSSPIQIKENTYLFSIIHDISEKIRIQENLKRMEIHLESLLEKEIHERAKILKKYELLFEQNYIGIGILKDSHLVEYNQKLVQLLRPLREEELKLNFFEIFNFSPEIDIHILSKQIKKNFFEVNLKKYPNKIYSLVLVPFEDLEKKETLNFLIFLNDITENKKIELEKKEQEELLFHQSKLAAIGESLTAIAHQWKQPLQSLQLMAYYLKEICKEPNIPKEILLSITDDILEQIAFMNEALQSFREFYQPSKEEHYFSVKEEIQKVIQILKFSLEKKQISLDLKGGDFTLFGNSNLFKHAILNLLNNSKDAILEKQKNTNSFKGKIFIEIIPEKKLIKIMDNGGGIPLEIQKKLFMPYVTTKTTEGSGLGLYITYQILKKMKGNIFFSEMIEPEEGACFNIKFR